MANEEKILTDEQRTAGTTATAGIKFVTNRKSV